MARAKKTSRILPKAEKRLAGMRSINANLNFSDGVSIPAFETSINSVRQTLLVYNTLLSKVDEAYNEVLDAEQDLAGVSKKMLLGVAFKYGKDSNEYEMAGGSREEPRPRRQAGQPTVGAATA